MNIFLAQTHLSATTDESLWLPLGIITLLIVGIIWALISRLRNEKNQDEFEDRDN